MKYYVSTGYFDEFEFDDVTEAAKFADEMHKHMVDPVEIEIRVGREHPEKRNNDNKDNG